MEEKNIILEENKVENTKPKAQFKIKQHFMRGLTTFLVVLACIACYFAFLRMDDIAKLVGKISGILQPIFIGFAFAYLLNPLVTQIEKYLIPLLSKNVKNEKKVKSFSRSIGITVSLLMAFAVVILLLNMVIPELYKSIRDLVLSLPQQINEAINYLENQKFNESGLSETVATVIESSADNLLQWIQTDLLRQVNQMMTSLTAGVINVVATLFNAAIGVIVSVYVLSSKEKFVGQCKKAAYALMTPEHANLMLHITRKSNEIFGGFVIGKIIDSIIIGILCFIGLSILDMPYTLLVSVIVGVTNVVPFFGPYIGAVPSTILILLDEPIKGIYFVIFILVLQQFDGNILGPKILGDSTGLSAFWVVFSILLGGGLFGFLGMIMGVPTFAVIYYLINMFLEQKLDRKKLPTASKDYEEVAYIEESGKKIFYAPDESKKKEK